MSQANPFWWPMLRGLPYFRAMLRAAEAGFYQGIELDSPVLDLGSGDGHFASVSFEKELDVGSDPSWKSLKESECWGGHRFRVQAIGERMPFAGGLFSSAVSNSVLEHVHELQEVLNEAGRLLKSGAPFLFSVPNERWPDHLWGSRALRKIGLRRLAEAYTQLFTRISRHVNMLSAKEWAEKLDRAGFEVEEYWHYFPPKELVALELGHYFGLPSLVSRWIFGRWILVGARWNLAITNWLFKGYGLSEKDKSGCYSFYVARKR